MFIIHLIVIILLLYVMSKVFEKIKLQYRRWWLQYYWKAIMMEFIVLIVLLCVMLFIVYLMIQNVYGSISIPTTIDKVSNLKFK